MTQRRLGLCFRASCCVSCTPDRRRPAKPRQPHIFVESKMLTRQRYCVPARRVRKQHECRLLTTFHASLASTHMQTSPSRCVCSHNRYHSRSFSQKVESTLANEHVHATLQPHPLSPIPKNWTPGTSRLTLPQHNGLTSCSPSCEAQVPEVNSKSCVLGSSTT